MTTPQRSACMIFKCIFYCNVRPLSCNNHRGEDPFSSHTWQKTTFLLACEEHTPDDLVLQDMDFTTYF